MLRTSGQALAQAVYPLQKADPRGAFRMSEVCAIAAKR
jgi:hypothetical protein